MPKHVDVKYTFVNKNTKTCMSGRTWVEGESFNDICDMLANHLDGRKDHLITKDLPGECPDEWEFVGFQDYNEWRTRVKRARSEMGNSNNA